MSYLLRLIIAGLLGWISAISAIASDPVLDNGQCYRLEIGSSGVYQINGEWLNENLNIAEGSIDIRRLKIYGIQGGALNESSTWNETERLKEIHVSVFEDGNGILDRNDKILFYTQGASKWEYNIEDSIYNYTINPYSSKAYVVLKISDEPHSIVMDTILSRPLNVSSEYLYHGIYHEDKVNLLGASNSNQGSGQEWFGTELSNLEQVKLNSLLPKRTSNLSDVVLEATVAGRSKRIETLKISTGDISVERNISIVNTADIESIYARKASLYLESNLISPDQDISLTYQKNDSEAGLWLDYLKIQGKTPIEFSGEATIINNSVAIANSNDGLYISNGADAVVWDVTNAFEVKGINKHIVSGNDISIAIDKINPQEFVVFDPVRTQLEPISGSILKNQSIAEIEDVDMILIYPESLREASNRLALHRAAYNNITIHQVDIQEIYNEYAAARPDPTAIRNYLRDLYRNETGLKYVLLMGDASYDFRHLLTEFPNENLIPTFQTQESLDPLLAFPSDDYYALLDDGENGQLSGDLDIAIGRIIVRNSNEANAVINKIIRYDDSQKSTGSWRTRLAFVADDEDNNLHINDADRIAEEVANRYPLFNQSKIYLDAFVQESTPGGNRYPTANNKLNQTVEQGAIVVNYLGHGGPNGWSQERVLKVDDINSWTNLDRLPLIITATCSFTGFDDPAIISAGEAALLQPNGGGIALFTTVRSVFASKNFRLTQSVFREIFEKENGLYLPIGEVMRKGKNNIPNDNTNARKFFMIGDPSMRLNIPNYEVTTTFINSQESDNDFFIVDTVGALDRVLIEGEIRNEFGDVAQNFSGELDVTVFDKPNLVSTLANDNSSFRKEYKSQDNVIYKGKVVVEEGKWETSFRVPIDINYTFGQAKISYYALSQDQIEATGYTKQLAIAGSSDQALDDDRGPDIDLFLNNRSFVSGATVGPNNLLVADLSDDNGLNLSSASIGHKMTAFIDDQAVTLNEFFIPSTDRPNGGTILYDLPEMLPGRHEIKLQAFDVANNVGAATIDFIVSDAFENNVSDVIIRPNPFRNQFVLNVNSDIRGSLIEMEVQLYNVMGKLLLTETKLAELNGNIYSAGFDSHRGASETLIALIRLRDRNTGIETIPVLKKIISLK